MALGKFLKTFLTLEWLDSWYESINLKIEELGALDPTIKSSSVAFRKGALAIRRSFWLQALCEKLYSDQEFCDYFAQPQRHLRAFFRTLSSTDMSHLIQDLTERGPSRIWGPRTEFLFLVASKRCQLSLDREKSYSFSKTSLVFTELYLQRNLATLQLYSSLGEESSHLDYLLWAVKKLTGEFQIAASPPLHLAHRLKWYFTGSINPSAASDFKDFRIALVNLLQQVNEVLNPEFSKAAYGFSPSSQSTSTINQPRIGLFRESLGPSAELELVKTALEDLRRQENIYWICFEPGAALTETTFDGHPTLVLDRNNLAESLKLLRAKNFALLINLSPLGGRFFNELLILLNARAAGKQISTIADVQTSGSSAIDGFVIGESYTHSALTTQFTESVVRAPGHGCRLYLQDLAPKLNEAVQPACAALSKEVKRTSATAKIFVSNAHVFKINRTTVELWIDCMKAAPGSQMVLMPAYSETTLRYLPLLKFLLKRWCDKKSFAFKRFQILPQVSGTSNVRSIMGQCDIYLDTTPYCASTSLLDCVACEIPLASLYDPLYRGQMGAAILKNMGLDNLIAGTKSEFVAQATRLASNPEAYQETKRYIQAAKQKLLTNNDQDFSAKFTQSLLQVLK